MSAQVRTGKSDFHRSNGFRRAGPGSKKCFLWITDPWDTLEHASDTTLRLAAEAGLLGVRNDWCDVRSIRWEEGRVCLSAQRLSTLGGKFTRSEPTLRSPGDYSLLQYRTDPPVDFSYIHPLQLLCLDETARKRIVNPPSALLMANEKLQGGLLGDLVPPTVVSSQRDTLEAFGRREGKAVLKPLHEAQSKGVKLLDFTRPSAAKASRLELRSASHGFMQPVLLQRFLPGISEGEVRLWFLDGKLLACARKLPLPGDFRVDIDRGSSLAPHRLTRAERGIAARIGKILRQGAVRLAAVDLIEGLITDFNFTSPGLIIQMERLLGANLARPIILAFLGTR